jgi:hypothetical protein
MAKKIVSLISILLVASLMLTSCNDSASKIDPEVIAGLDADYYIDYENGTIPIGDLPIGARVVDPSWEWEYRLGVNYSDQIVVPGTLGGGKTRPGKVKPVTWIVVAKDHYDLGEEHVTLLSEELIGRFVFDDSNDRGHENESWGHNHWGESGTANATHGLRPWLNSSGIHSGEGFYRAFSEEFKRAVPATTLPNKEWENGNSYSTQDYVFIPSTTELGDSAHKGTYQIGTVYPYFAGANDAKRVARLDGETWWYWTRSPASDNGSSVRDFSNTGSFEFNYSRASKVYDAVRPALNLKPGILVSEIKN